MDLENFGKKARAAALPGREDQPARSGDSPQDLGRGVPPERVFRQQKRHLLRGGVRRPGGAAVPGGAAGGRLSPGPAGDRRRKPGARHRAGPADHVPGPGPRGADGRPAAPLPGEGLGEAGPLPPLYRPPNRNSSTTTWGPIWRACWCSAAAGCDLVSYLTPRLFEHLGITRPTWEMDPLGHTFGAGGLFLTLSELHTFGQFYLQNGRWNGRQLLDPAWVKASTSKQVENGAYGLRLPVLGRGAGHLPGGRQIRPALHSVPGQGRGHHRGGGVPGCPLPDGPAIFDELYPQL